MVCLHSRCEGDSASLVAVLHAPRGKGPELLLLKTLQEVAGHPVPVVQSRGGVLTHGDAECKRDSVHAAADRVLLLLHVGEGDVWVGVEAEQVLREGGG